MFAIRHILYPIDFSQRCLNAAGMVEAMAKTFQARVTLLSVAQPMVYGGAIEGMPAYIDMNLLKQGVEARLAETLRDEFASVNVARVVEMGEAGQEIVEFSKKEHVDLIMLPTHGYGPFRRLLLGSITAKVLHDASCAVWTEAHMEKPDLDRHRDCERVLCAVDRNAQTPALMRWAADFAKAAGASLRIIHSVGGAEAFPERQFDLEFEQTLREQARKELGELAKSLGIDAPLCIKTGNVARAVREEAEGHDADLVVIGRGVIHETLGRLRTEAYAIIRQAHCPVISV